MVFGYIKYLKDAIEATVGNVWDKDISGYVGVGYAGTYVKTVYDDWLNGGRLDLILDAIAADTAYIADGALPADPTANSLARFIASGGTALGTQLPASKSLYDIILEKLPNIQDVIIYPVSEHAGTAEITDDGTSPAYYADTESGTATVEGTPNVHWLEDINFEQVGTITIISMYIEFEWEHKTSAGTAYSKIQISRDGGSNWVDITDSIAETNAAYQNKLRAGVGNFVSTIVAGANQLQFRLVSWEAAGGTSSAKIRSNSYVRITYRKS